jgi:hypothetical protein
VALGVAALIGPAACGGEDSQPLVGPPPRSDPAALDGTWTGKNPGYTLRYVFRPDGTYRYSSLMRQKREGGTATFTITARGTFKVRQRTLLLRPRSGTKERRDPDDPDGDYTRRLERFPQRYGWTIRGTGKDARLTLTIGGGLAVTYRRG